MNHAKGYVQDLLDHIELYQAHVNDPPETLQEHQDSIDLDFIRKVLSKLLDSMLGAADRITGISKSLRTFSRSDSEVKVMADLKENIDSTLLILKYRLKANSFRPAIEIETDYNDLEMIPCFPGQLNQVFMNLFANAIDMFDEMATQHSYDYFRDRPQKLKITLQRSNFAVKIVIQDNGLGMPEEVKTRIFDHLFTTKAVGKGTGLGLSIVRQIIVETHGGAIEVESEVGVGTCFILTLPIPVIESA